MTARLPDRARGTQETSNSLTVYHGEAQAADDDGCCLRCNRVWNPTEITIRAATARYIFSSPREPSRRGSEKPDGPTGLCKYLYAVRKKIAPSSQGRISKCKHQNAHPAGVVVSQQIGSVRPSVQVGRLAGIYDISVLSYLCCE